MSKFTPTVKWETDFDGDHVVFELRRLTNEQMMKLAPCFPTELATGGAFLRSVKLVSEAKEVLRSCVVSMHGLTDSQEQEMKLERILDEGYFIRLLDSLLGRVLKVSMLTEDEIKKLDAVSLGEQSGAAPNPTVCVALPSDGGATLSMPA
jgi:hypothetical protein